MALLPFSEDAVRFCEVVCKYKALGKQHVRIRKYSYYPDGLPLTAHGSPGLVLATWSFAKNQYSHLGERCVITQFLGKIIKSPVSTLVSLHGLLFWELPLWVRGRILCLDVREHAMAHEDAKPLRYSMFVAFQGHRSTRARNAGTP